MAFTWIPLLCVVLCSVNCQGPPPPGSPYDPCKSKGEMNKTLENYFQDRDESVCAPQIESLHIQDTQGVNCTMYNSMIPCNVELCFNLYEEDAPSNVEELHHTVVIDEDGDASFNVTWVLPDSNLDKLVGFQMTIYSIQKKTNVLCQTFDLRGNTFTDKHIGLAKVRFSHVWTPAIADNVRPGDDFLITVKSLPIAPVRKITIDRVRITAVMPTPTSSPPTWPTTPTLLPPVLWQADDISAKQRQSGVDDSKDDVVVVKFTAAPDRMNFTKYDVWLRSENEVMKANVSHTSGVLEVLFRGVCEAGRYSVWVRAFERDAAGSCLCPYKLGEKECSTCANSTETSLDITGCITSTTTPTTTPWMNTEPVIEEVKDTALPPRQEVLPTYAIVLLAVLAALLVFIVLGVLIYRYTGRGSPDEAPSSELTVLVTGHYHSTDHNKTVDAFCRFLKKNFSNMRVMSTCWEESKYTSDEGREKWAGHTVHDADVILIVDSANLSGVCEKAQLCKHVIWNVNEKLQGQTLRAKLGIVRFPHHHQDTALKDFPNIWSKGHVFSLMGDMENLLYFMHNRSKDNDRLYSHFSEENYASKKGGSELKKALKACTDGEESHQFRSYISSDSGISDKSGETIDSVSEKNVNVIMANNKTAPSEIVTEVLQKEMEAVNLHYDKDTDVDSHYIQHVNEDYDKYTEVSEKMPVHERDRYDANRFTNGYIGGQRVGSLVGSDDPAVTVYMGEDV